MRLLIFGNGYHTNKNLIPMVSEYQDRFSHVVVVDPYLNSLTKKLQGFQYAKSVEELSSEQFDVCWVANSTKKHSFALKQMLKNVVSRVFLIEKPMFTNLMTSLICQALTERYLRLGSISIIKYVR